jgi:hypothetical protein
MASDITNAARKRSVRESLRTIAAFLTASGVVLLLVFGTSPSSPPQQGAALVQP